jgi:hypothetical protein
MPENGIGVQYLWAAKDPSGPVLAPCFYILTFLTFFGAHSFGGFQLGFFTLSLPWKESRFVCCQEL